MRAGAGVNDGKIRETPGAKALASDVLPTNCPSAAAKLLDSSNVWSDVAGVFIECAPSMSRELRVDATPLAESGTILGKYLAVGMAAIRAIPYVLNSPPSVVVRKIVGAYDWPAR